MTKKFYILLLKKLKSMSNKISFIFPADPLNRKKCDDHYLKEFKALSELGFECFVIDPFDDGSSLYPHVENFQHKTFIYRGWMLSKDQYTHLYNKTFKQLKVSPKEYLNSHHLPNWYSNLKEFTFPTHILDDDLWENFFKENPGKKFFAKDYVKSLKTNDLSFIHNFEDFQKFSKSVLKYKGFVEGGIILRDFMELQKDTESRFFAFNGNLFYPETLTYREYFDSMHELAIQVKGHHTENFFSIDIVLDLNNKPYLVEIGDGQVSDYTGWEVSDFTKIFLNINPRLVMA